MARCLFSAKKRFNLFLLMLLLISPIVFAASIPVTINNAFRDIHNILKQQYVFYGITITLFFMLFYGAFASGLRRWNVFQEDGGGNWWGGQNGGGLSRTGQAIALALSGLSTSALLWSTRDAGIQKILERYLIPFGWFGGVAIGFVFFAIIYWGFGCGNARGLAWASAGFAMYAVGTIINIPFVTGVGAIIGVIGAIYLLFSSI